MMTSGKPTIRHATREELDRIRELHGTVFGERSREHLEARFSWQFERNPVASSVPSVHWVAVLGERIVGSLSSFPARLKLGEHLTTIMVPCDLLVSPEARGRSLAQKLLAAHHATCGELSVALAYAPRTIRLYDRLGYARLAAEPHFLRPVNLTTWSLSQVRRRLGEGGGLSRAAQAVAACVAAAASLPLKAVNGAQRPAASLATRLSVAARPDARFDAVWARVSPGVPACFVRDSAFVGWRYFEDPLSRHTVLIAQDTAGQALGFLAYRLRQRQGVKYCQIMDVFCEPTAPDVARQLVRECLQREEKGVDVVTAKGLHPAIRGAVRQSLYVDRSAKSLPAMLRWRAGNGGPEALREAGAWHLAHADGDEDFMP